MAPGLAWLMERGGCIIGDARQTVDAQDLGHAGNQKHQPDLRVREHVGVAVEAVVADAVRQQQMCGRRECARNPPGLRAATRRPRPAPACRSRRTSSARGWPGNACPAAAAPCRSPGSWPLGCRSRTPSIGGDVADLAGIEVLAHRSTPPVTPPWRIAAESAPSRPRERRRLRFAPQVEHGRIVLEVGDLVVEVIPVPELLLRIVDLREGLVGGDEAGVMLLRGRIVVSITSGGKSETVAPPAIRRSSASGSRCRVRHHDGRSRRCRDLDGLLETPPAGRSISPWLASAWDRVPPPASRAYSSTSRPC